MPVKPRPRQARTYPTLKQWVSSPENLEWIKGLIADPRFQALLHYSKDIYRIRIEDLMGPKAVLDEVVIRKASVHAGANAFEEMLQDLLAPAAPHIEDEPFAYILPKTR